MSEYKKKLEPLGTVIGALSVKLPNGSFHTFQVLYGGALYPWVDGKMQYVKQDMYKKILRDFLSSEEGKEYEVPTETEIMEVRTEILNNDRKGLYTLADESSNDVSEEKGESFPTNEQDNSESAENTPLNTNEESEDEEISDELENNADSLYNSDTGADDVQEAEKPSGIETYDENNMEPALDEMEQFDLLSNVEANGEGEMTSAGDKYGDGDDYEEFIRMLRIIAVNSSELLEINKNHSLKIAELEDEIRRQTSEIKKSKRTEQIILITVILFGLLIPTLYYVGKMYGLI